MLSGKPVDRSPAGPDLERHLFWRGQLLASRDLNALVASEAERMAWHDRAVHDAYGIVAGLAVAPAPAAPAGVTVGPGLAYDAYGWLLAVAVETRVPAPAGLGRRAEASWALLLRRAAGGLAGDSGCGCGAGAGGGEAGPLDGELVWRRAEQVGVKDGVALARGRWISGVAGWVFVADEAFRPLPARPVARPRLGRGATTAGGTAWRPWTQPLGGSAVVGHSRVLPPAARGIEVAVDTAAAGFTRTPCYFAWLQGGPWQVAHRLALTLPLSRLTAAARDRFTFSLWDPVASNSRPILASEGGFDAAQALQGQFLDLARRRLYVCWLGIEIDRPTFTGKVPALTARRQAGPR